MTDNDSAKMKTSHGVLQGYDGLAVVDAKHQVVVHAQAFGEAQEHELLHPMIDAARENFQAIGKERNVFRHTAITADSGFHTEHNVRRLFEQGIEGWIADKLFRKRHRAEQRQSRHSLYRPADFLYDPAAQTCTCPAGKALYRNGSSCWLKGYEFVKFTGPKRHGVPCTQRSQCLRHPERTSTRSVVFFKDRSHSPRQTYTAKMKVKIDSQEGRWQYSSRLAVAEPVFGNITHNRRLKRFSLRGWAKVDIQWKLYYIVHNLLKIHRYGCA